MVQQQNIGDLQTKDMELNRESEREKCGEGQSPIRQFFRGRSLFITGSSGFIGKILVEKLLRCCPEIEKMYLLLRPKKGLKPEERLQKILDSELFSIVKKQNPNFGEKLVVVYGDIENPNLGLSEEDISIIQANVSVVYHQAARVRYDDHLRTAVRHQMVGTKSVLELCQKMPKLTVVVYLSTAYVHREPDLTAPEEVVPCKITPDELLNALEWMDDDTVSKITPFLLRDKFNNYFLTKALTENLLVERHGNIPVAIVRPCIVGSTWKEPFPGWCDTLQGPSGLLLAASKGFLRTLYSRPNLTIAAVPADIVVNTMIASSWAVATKRVPDVLIVNCVQDDDKLLPGDEEVLSLVISKRSEYPLVNMYRYPDFTLYYRPVLYKIHAFFDHLIPAYFIDLLLYIFTGKPFMVKLYRRIEDIFNVFVLVGIKPWIIKNENYHVVEKAMSDKDKEVFFMDMDNFDWYEYIEICMVGGRKFMAHEDPSNIPYARRLATIRWFVTTLLKWMIIFGLMYYIFCKCEVFFTDDV